MAKTLSLLRCGIAVESIISIVSISTFTLTLMLDSPMLIRVLVAGGVCRYVDRLARESLSQRPES
jgi:hypothetical protein